MIPILAVAGIRTARSHRFRLWIPLFLVWLSLLPLLLLLLPVALIACWVFRVSPLQSLSVCWQILSGLKGTHVEVDHSGSSVLLRIL